MRLGQIGRRGFRWVALLGAAFALVACQSTGAPDSASPRKDASAQPATATPPDDTASFLGLGQQDLSRKLGTPRLVRRDAPAEVWQYAGADCVVDFYLYSGEAGLSVAYMEARDQAAEMTRADRCVQSLLQPAGVKTAQQEAL